MIAARCCWIRAAALARRLTADLFRIPAPRHAPQWSQRGVLLRASLIKVNERCGPRG